MKTSIPLIINGKAVIPPKSFDVINPATGEPFASVAAGDVSHLDAAVAAAREAFPSWSNTADGKRQSLLHAIADAL
ncbi:MAG TPA: aldehyde dehydrogenase family protein, partial [Chthoniobacterales bacterium]|nr:aldehyde dehydrogenase family protein [Chthoniobacterales bacterium]